MFLNMHTGTIWILHTSKNAGITNCMGKYRSWKVLVCQEIPYIYGNPRYIVLTRVRHRFCICLRRIQSSRKHATLSRSFLYYRPNQDIGLNLINFSSLQWANSGTISKINSIILSISPAIYLLNYCHLEILHISFRYAASTPYRLDTDSVVK